MHWRYEDYSSLYEQYKLIQESKMVSLAMSKFPPTTCWLFIMAKSLYGNYSLMFHQNTYCFSQLSFLTKEKVEPISKKTVVSKFRVCRYAHAQLSLQEIPWTATHKRKKTSYAYTLTERKWDDYACILSWSLHLSQPYYHPFDSKPGHCYHKPSR